jgi:antitoxin YefM
MSTMTYTEARENLASAWDKAVSTREPIILKRRGKEDIAIIAADELAAYVETAHLLRSPANARRLLLALDRSLGRGRGKGLRMSMEELRKKFAPDGTRS